MDRVEITNIDIINPEDKMKSKIRIQVEARVREQIKSAFNIMVIYVGSAEDASKDQVLKKVLMPPLQPGLVRFKIVSDCPDFNRIERDELLGITVLMITFLYHNQEFFRCSYFIYNHQRKLNF